MNHSTARRTLAALLAGGGLLAFATTVGAQGIGLDELERMLVPTDRKLERGERVYHNQCAGCHGDDGAGGVEYPADRFANPVPDLTAGEYRHGEGPIEVYNTISKGLTDAEEATHPTYKSSLRYQQRWAVTHYVRSLSGDELETDPPEVVDQARFEAENGVCDPAIKETIAGRVEPKGDEQLSTGEEIYNNQCASCHGDSGEGDGAAGQALDPAPRNFQATDVEWTNGTSPLNIFNSVTNGVEGTAMASFGSLSEDERWAVTHYIRQWVPEDQRQEATEEDIVAVCRSLSTPDPPEPIAVDRAMEVLVDEQSEERYVRLARLGPIQVAPEASVERGRDLYERECAECHGEGLQGVELGPLGVERAPDDRTATPLLSFEVRRLVPAHAGGNYRDFAERSSGGVHATLPDMSSASLLSERDWKDLHAYLASVDGEGELGTLRPGEIEVGSSVDEEAAGDGSADADQSEDTEPDASEQASEETGSPEPDTETSQ